MTVKILLAEDDERLRRLLQLVLNDAGYEVQTAADGGRAIEYWKKWHPSLVFTDLMMEPLNGLHVLRFGQDHYPDIPCIILTAFGTVEAAVDAMKKGAFDFLTKPIDHTQLLEVVKQAIEANLQTKHHYQDLLGSSEVMQALRNDINSLASTDSTVLILGESGTGKGLVAKEIHKASKRHNGPFVHLNCASIPAELLESELFGHKKGSFTGSTGNHDGAFTRADGGILFLDEIGDLLLSLQPKLLHAVEEKEFLPLGGTKPQAVSLKILSSTNLDLKEMVNRKEFRMDLFYRLNTMQVTLPPLRNRGNDIIELTNTFLTFFSNEFDCQECTLSEEAFKIIETYSWPGNVRELRNTIERAVLRCPGKAITADCISEICSTNDHTQPENPKTNLDLVAKEQEFLLAALKLHNWNKTKAAKELKISRSALRYRLKKYGITNS